MGITAVKRSSKQNCKHLWIILNFELDCMLLVTWWYTGIWKGSQNEPEGSPGDLGYSSNFYVFPHEIQHLLPLQPLQIIQIAYIKHSMPSPSRIHKP